MKTTQKELALAELRKGPLTPLEALYRGCGMRLPAIIFDLKADGYVFEETEIVCEDGKRFARYTLVSEPVQQQAA